MFTECTLSALERVGWGDGESIFTSDDSGLEEICIIFWLRQCILSSPVPNPKPPRPSPNPVKSSQNQFQRDWG